MSDESSESKTDDFEALIDLLAVDDGEGPEPQPLRHGSQPVLSAPNLVFATISSNLRISPDPPHQERPVELNENIATVDQFSVDQEFSAQEELAPFDVHYAIEDDELDIPSFPPMSPVLRSVRSTNNIESSSRQGSGISLHESTVRKLALGNLNVSPPPVELLPVSPFLLSPALHSTSSRSSPASGSSINVLDVSKSPFFVQAVSSDLNLAYDGGPDEDMVGMESKPVGVLESIAPVTATETRLPALVSEKGEFTEEAEGQITVSDSAREEQAPDGAKTHLEAAARIPSPVQSLRSKPTSLHQLNSQLQAARAEVKALQKQCDELRKQAEMITPSRAVKGTPAVSGNHTSTRSAALSTAEPRVQNTRQRSASVPTSADLGVTPQAGAQSSSEIDKMTGEEAKLTLKSILSFFNLPSSAFQSLPSLQPRTTTGSVHATVLSPSRTPIARSVEDKKLSPSLHLSTPITTPVKLPPLSHPISRTPDKYVHQSVPITGAFESSPLHANSKTHHHPFTSPSPLKKGPLRSQSLMVEAASSSSPSTPPSASTPSSGLKPTSTSSGPRSFADIQRAVSFVQLADDLVWKRSQWGIMFDCRNRNRSPSLSPSANRRMSNNKNPLSSEEKNAQNGIFPGPSGSSGGFLRPLATNHLSVVSPSGNLSSASSSMRRPPTSDHVFDSTNIKALEDRLVLWERAVRTRVTRSRAKR